MRTSTAAPSSLPPPGSRPKFTAVHMPKAFCRSLNQWAAGILTEKHQPESLSLQCGLEKQQARIAITTSDNVAAGYRASLDADVHALTAGKVKKHSINKDPILCGIYGCLLAERHSGLHVFHEFSGKKRRSCRNHHRNNASNSAVVASPRKRGETSVAGQSEEADHDFIDGILIRSVKCPLKRFSKLHAYEAHAEHAVPLCDISAFGRESAHAANGANAQDSERSEEEYVLPPGPKLISKHARASKGKQRGLSDNLEVQDGCLRDLGVNNLEASQREATSCGNQYFVIKQSSKPAVVKLKLASSHMQKPQSHLNSKQHNLTITPMARNFTVRHQNPAVPEFRRQAGHLTWLNRLKGVWRRSRPRQIEAAHIGPIDSVLNEGTRVTYSVHCDVPRAGKKASKKAGKTPEELEASQQFIEWVANEKQKWRQQRGAEWDCQEKERKRPAFTIKAQQDTALIEYTHQTLRLPHAIPDIHRTGMAKSQEKAAAIVRRGQRHLLEADEEPSQINACTRIKLGRLPIRVVEPWNPASKDFRDSNPRFVPSHSSWSRDRQPVMCTFPAQVAGPSPTLS